MIGRPDILEYFSSLEELEKIHNDPQFHAGLLIEQISLELATTGVSLIRIGSMPIRAETLSIVIRKFRRYGIVVHPQDGLSEIRFSVPAGVKELTPAKVKEILDGE